jgi:hypothetical protein
MQHTPRTPKKQSMLCELNVDHRNMQYEKSKKHLTMERSELSLSRTQVNHLNRYAKDTLIFVKFERLHLRTVMN